MSTRDSMPPDPLDHEERELAARLARIAPAAGPSASLDARILAMAREAVPPVAPSPPVRARRRARWLPAGLVTAMGTAAAFVVVVGVVWQLRPQSPQVRVHAGDEESAVVVAETVKRRQVLVAPAPPPGASAPAAAADMPAAVAQAQAQPRPAAKAATRPAASRSPAAAPAEVSAEINDEWQARDLASDASAVAEAAPAAAPPPPPPAPTVPAARAAGVAADARTGVSETQAQAANSADLDRITVTGSRIALPTVSDDATLDPADWLQRIRMRRDRGELDAARESLARFRRSHPRIRIPDDLRSLQR